MHRAGVRVCLDGEGSDGILGSSPEYLETALEDAAAHFRLRRYGELQSVLSGLAGGNFDVEQITIPGKFLRLVKRGLKGQRSLQSFWPLIRFLRGHLRKTLGKADLSTIPVQSLLQHSGRPISRRDKTVDLRTRNLNTLQAMLFTKFHGSTLATTVASFDRAAMAHGVELRMPFFDWRLVTYAFALTDTSRNGDGFTKLVLRLAMQDLMPDSIRLRTSKFGFISPMDKWARGALKPWLLDISGSQSFIESSVWHGPAVKSVVERAVAGHTSIMPVWPILNAHSLQQSFKARASSARLERVASAAQDVAS